MPAENIMAPHGSMCGRGDFGIKINVAGSIKRVVVDVEPEAPLDRPSFPKFFFQG